MSENLSDLLRLQDPPQFDHATLVLAFSGWMDGGDVSTGTVNRLVHLLNARPLGEIDPELFYIYNFPGSMELTALFRPEISVEGGLLKKMVMPTNQFYVHEPAKLVLFVGKEPNLRWRTFGECIFDLTHRVGVRRILFVGSFGGSTPHTRQPRVFTNCSDAALLPEMERFGFRPSTYEGPGSFTNYLMSQAEPQGLEMISLVAEIPSYLQGTNPMCIEAVTRRLAKILKLPLELDSLRAASTEWELKISAAVEENKELEATVRQLEEAYDNELIQETEES